MKQCEILNIRNKHAYSPLVNVIIVTFNPNIKNLFNNLDKFFKGVKTIFLVDNSDDLRISNQIRSNCQKYKNIIYFHLACNKGIGFAQNKAIRYCVEENYNNDELILFFDQEHIKDLVNHFLGEKRINEKIAMLGATTIDADTERGITVAPHIISSGSIVSLGDFKKIGYFDEELFIDFIDFAWCWKAKSMGYQVMIDHDVFLHHQTTGKLETIFGKGIDSPNRLYYVYRNVIISLNRYSPNFSFSFGWYRHLLLKAIFQIIVAKSRWKRTKKITKGIWDGMNGNTGK